MEEEQKKKLVQSILEVGGKLLEIPNTGDQFRFMVTEGVLDIDQLVADLKTRLKLWRLEHIGKSYRKAEHFFKCAAELAVIPSRTVTEPLESVYTKAIGLSPSLKGEIGVRYDKKLALAIRLHLERAKLCFRKEDYMASINDLYTLVELFDVSAAAPGEDFDLVSLTSNSHIFQNGEVPDKEPLPTFLDVLYLTIECFNKIKLISNDELDEMRKTLKRFAECIDMEHEKIEDEGRENFGARGLNLVATLVSLLELNSNHSNYCDWNFSVNFGPVEAQLKQIEPKTEGWSARYILNPKVISRRLEGKGRSWMAAEKNEPKDGDTSVVDGGGEGIKKGEVLLVERPYCVVVEKALLGRFCDHCLLKIESTPVDCDQCDEVAYCSIQCRRKAQQEYHHFECGHLGLVRSIGMSSTLLYRIMNRIGLEKAIAYEALYNPTSYEVGDYLANEHLQAVDGLNEDQQFQIYRMATSLMSHNDRPVRPIDVFFLVSAIEVALVMVLTKKSLTKVYVNADGNGKVKVDLLANVVQLFFVYIKRILVNIFGYYDFSEAQAKPSTSNLVGNCHFLLASLFNHSCESNAKWSIEAGHIILKASRNIEPGEELTISYGPSQANSLIQRQTQLYEAYHFACSCSLCISDAATSEMVIGCSTANCHGPVVLTKNAQCLRCSEVYPVELIEMKVAFLNKSRNYLRLVAQLDFLTIEKDVEAGLLEGQLEAIEASLEEIHQLYNDGMHYFESVYHKRDFLLLAKVWLKLNHPKLAFEIAENLFQGTKPILELVKKSKEKDGDDGGRHLEMLAQLIVDHHWWVSIVLRNQMGSAPYSNDHVHLFISLLVSAFKLCVAYIDEAIARLKKPNAMDNITDEGINLIYGLSLADMIGCMKQVCTSHSIPMETITMEGVYPVTLAKII